MVIGPFAQDSIRKPCDEERRLADQPTLLQALRPAAVCHEPRSSCWKNTAIVTRCAQASVEELAGGATRMSQLRRHTAVQAPPTSRSDARMTSLRPSTRDAGMDWGPALLNVRQMAEAERLSRAAGISAREWMNNAGACVADAIIARWTLRPLLVLCGPGNNGGDGLVVAQRLTEGGWPVRVAMGH